VQPGSQQPRVSLVPPSVHNDAEDAIDLAAGYGLVADEWQESVLEGWLGLKANGKWAAPRCGLAVPRQNGKNGILEVRELFGMIMRGEKFLHTAHEVKTARKAFQRLLGFFENERKYPELAAMVKEIRKTNGQEAIILDNGGSVEFIARSKGSGRGFTVDVLVCDEAQELSDDSLAALLPTISAAPLGNPQTILTGTPPGPKMNGEVFARMRTAGVKRTDNRLCWKEWSLLPGDDLNDRFNWAKANPSLGGRLAIDTIADERSAMDDDTFGRERGGIWDDEEETGSAIPASAWGACVAPGEMVTAPVFALDVSPNHSWAAIAAAGRRDDGVLHVEVTTTDEGRIVDHREGTDWIIPRLIDMCTRWDGLTVNIAAGSGAEALKPEIEELGITVKVIPSAKVPTACGFMYDKATTGGIRHLGQEPLTTAVKAARKHQEDGETAWKFGRRKSSGDITPLYAATLAVWALVDVDDDHGEVSVYGFNDLDACDGCGQKPHEDPDGDHNYLCIDCRDKEN
jgi:hypothetical protein